MNLDEARALAHRIIDTWPAFAIKAHIWCDGLADLDHAQAVAAYEYLRCHDEKPPSVARFRDTYRTQAPNLGWQRPLDNGEPISLDEYLRRRPDDHAFDAYRDREPAGSASR